MKRLAFRLVIAQFAETEADIHSMIIKATLYIAQVLDAVMKKQSHSGQGLTHYCAKNGQARRLKRWAQMGFDLNEQDHSGCTPLHLAVWHENEKAVQVLLGAHVDVNARDKDLTGPLTFAVMHCNTSLTHQLLKAGADIHSQDKFNRTALDYAKKGSHPELIQLLESWPAKQEAALLENSLDARGPQLREDEPKRLWL